MEIESGNVHTKQNGERGWILGHFPQLAGTPFHTDAFEVKWSKLAKGQRKEGVGTNQTAPSVSILISGKFKIDFPESGESHILQKEGDYVFFGPGVAHTWEVLEDTLSITLRWPSLPEDQTKI